jgi:two-component system phosphate regulon sensor histidine kinase PhoR
MLRVAVTDTGPGIPKESMTMLFKKFSKIDYSYAKHSNQPGTGLGLYISKQIISLHHGDIQVQSEVNVGTTFTVLLPLSTSLQAPEQTQSTAPQEDQKKSDGDTSTT